MSCGTGGGHNAAAAAVMEELCRRGHHVQMLNPYTLISNRLAERINHTYVGLVQRTPRVFGVVYQLGNLYRRLPFRSPVYFMNRMMVPAMQQYLSEHHFDVVVMPHLFPAEILTNMKDKGLPVPKMVFVATDYTCIPFTEETKCDAYITPSPLLEEDFLRRGIAGEKLYPLGIPTKAQFASPLDKPVAKKQLGLEADRRYIMVCGGSMGAGSLARIVGLLLTQADAHTGIIVICGSNKKLYQKLKEKYGACLHLVGQTDQMAAYMKACDLVLTKPGGLSSTEATVAQTALIHITPIPGCETINMRFFEENGLCIPVRCPKRQLLQACASLTDSAQKAQMQKRQRDIINPHAAYDICDLIEKGI